MPKEQDWKTELDANIQRFSNVVELDSADDEANRLFNRIVDLLTGEIERLEQDKTNMAEEMNMAKRSLEDIGRWLFRDDMSSVQIPISAALALQFMREGIEKRTEKIDEYLLNKEKNA